MKKALSVILVIIMIVSAVATVSAGAVPDDYLVYQLNGMQRVLASSSIIDKNTGLDSGLLFDHRTGTSLTFNFSDKETKSVSLIVASRDCEKIEKFALLIDHDEKAVVEISLSVTNDPELKTWTPVDLHGENVVSEDESGNETVGTNKDGWKVLNVDELSEGFAFYRFDFEMWAGEEFTIYEVALFRAKEAGEIKDPTVPKTIFEREPWRVVWALNGGSLLSIPKKMPR